MIAAFFTGVFAYRHRNEVRAVFRSIQSGPMVETNLYIVTIDKLSTPGFGKYGAVAALERGVLAASADGRLWYVNEDRVLRQLNHRVPINVEEFLQDPFTQGAANKDNFAVKDLIVQQLSDGIRLFASHNQWHSDGQCNTLRISTLEITVADLISGEQPPAEWSTLWDSRPCKELSPLPNGGLAVTLGAGGRLAMTSDHQLLVTVGLFGPESANTEDAAGAQDPTNSYGKTILIDTRTSESRLFTMGHRNPQGLAVHGSDIWSTEHAARGGDELNRLLDGANYGYPYVSYGTTYEGMTWPSNPRQGHHEGFEPATFTWIPSIGISQVVVLEGTLFPLWEGDLFVSSLRARSVFRVSIQNGRAVVSEPIPVEHRIRDIVEAADGTIVLKADDNFLLFLTPVNAASEELAPEERGRVLANQCRACHTFLEGAPHAQGPNLWGIVGGQIAARSGFAYSEALRALDGRWSPELLRLFLLDPEEVVPGTSMTMPVIYDERQVADIIAYLRTVE